MLRHVAILSRLRQGLFQAECSFLCSGTSESGGLALGRIFPPGEAKIVSRVCSQGLGGHVLQKLPGKGTAVNFFSFFCDLAFLKKFIFQSHTWLILSMGIKSRQEILFPQTFKATDCSGAF